jgi:DNA-binding MarR family transcriptional regulator
MQAFEPNHEEPSIPVLLRGARETYGSAIHEALSQAGCDDLPKNGSYVIGAIARNKTPLAEIVRALGLSKQAAGQLVDTLVVRGYLDRFPDSEDRRRLALTLTVRGLVAYGAAREAIETVDMELSARIGSELMETTRSTLNAIIEIGKHFRADSDNE